MVRKLHFRGGKAVEVGPDIDEDYIVRKLAAVEAKAKTLPDNEYTRIWHVNARAGWLALADEYKLDQRKIKAKEKADAGN